ncbi:Acyl-CoA synthetase member 2 mitochondrial [Mactra antiquata]
MSEPYTQSYIKRTESDFTSITKKNLIQFLEENKQRQPDDEAFVFVQTNGDPVRINWLNLWERCLSTAKGLSLLGVRAGAIVAINLRCCAEWLYATFGAMMLGAIPVSVSFTYTDGSDLIELMKKMGKCSVLIMDPGLENVNWNIINKLLDKYDNNGEVSSTQLPTLRVLIGHAFDASMKDVKKFEDLLTISTDDFKIHDIKPDDIALMMQTSGSTGSPKFVVHAHSTFTALASTRMVLTDNRYKLFNERPFSWIGGFPFSILTGMCRVCISGFCQPPENFTDFLLKVLVKEQCTSVLGMPPFVNGLMKEQDNLPENWPVKVILTGGQPLSKNIVNCVGKVCESMCSMYASTEFFAGTQGSFSDPEKFTEHSSGVPPNLGGLEIKIVNDQGDIVPVNTRGELYIRTPCLFKGYFNDPDKTSQVMTQDGWYRTDDMGQMNERGEFIVGGRKSNMILSRGMNVAPEIMEVVLKKCPGVENAIVVPVPDETAYQDLCACIIKKAGSNLQESNLREFCARIHADKPGIFTVLPKYYIFCDTFPETSTGKVSRKALEKMAVEKCTM